MTNQIIPTTEYTVSDLVYLLGISPEDIRKKMEGYKVDEKGQYFGDDIVRSGLGVADPNFKMPKPRKPKILVHGFELNRIYSIQEIADIFSMSKSVVKNRFLKADIPLVGSKEQAKAGFNTEEYRFFGKDVIDAIKNHKLNKPVKISKKLDELIPVENIPEKTTSTKLAGSIIFLKKAVEGMDKAEAVMLLKAFTEGLETETL